MRKHLQIALMASPVIATFLSFATPQLQAQSGFGAVASITSATDDSGRKIYVNDAVPIAPRRMPASTTSQSTGLMYWSPSAHHWKPVPSAKIGAARSAAAEVNSTQQVS